MGFVNDEHSKKRSFSTSIQPEFVQSSKPYWESIWFNHLLHVRDTQNSLKQTPKTSDAVAQTSVRSKRKAQDLSPYKQDFLRATPKESQVSTHIFLSPGMCLWVKHKRRVQVGCFVCHFLPPLKGAGRLSLCFTVSLFLLGRQFIHWNQ